MIFEVKGKPQGKARARTFYNKNTKHMQSYTPEQTASYEDLVRWSYKAAGGEYLGEQVIKVNIIAYYEIPKSWSRKKRIEAIDGQIKPTCKPDCDNIIKIILDALNGVAYKDDAQVISVSCEKHYSVDPLVQVFIFKD